MKTLVQKSNTAKTTPFARFTAAQMSKTQLKMIKGGDGDSTEVIIVEDLIQG